MPTFHQQNLEQQLISQLQCIEVPYRRALALIDATVSQQQNPTAAVVAHCLVQLQPLMLEIQQHEGTLAPLRQAWIGSSFHPQDDLRGVMNLHEQLLGNLLSRINSMEEHLQQTRRQLTPQVDAHVRHQSMQKAYQQRVRA